MMSWYADKNASTTTRLSTWCFQWTFMYTSVTVCLSRNSLSYAIKVYLPRQQDKLNPQNAITTYKPIAVCVSTGHF